MILEWKSLQICGVILGRRKKKVNKLAGQNERNRRKNEKGKQKTVNFIPNWVTTSNVNTANKRLFILSLIKSIKVVETFLSVLNNLVCFFVYLFSQNFANEMQRRITIYLQNYVTRMKNIYCEQEIELEEEFLVILHLFIRLVVYLYVCVCGKNR